MANKKKDPCAGCGDQLCAACDHKAHKALSMKDIEDMSKQVATETLAGDLPYNREVYILQVKVHVRRSIEDILVAGKMLAVLREKEGYGSFTKIVEEEIGIPHTTAYKFMNAALKAEKYPTLNFSQLGKACNVYAILEAPEEDLKELETKGILAGRDIDELQRMSVKEMRDMIKSLKAGVDKIVKEEVRALETEKKALVKEVERLRVFDPSGKDVSWSVKMTEQIDKILNEYDTALRAFAFDDRILEHPDLQAKVEAIHRGTEKRFKLFVKNWDAFVDGGTE